MKKLTGLVIILAALLLGGYYGMGVLTERTIKKNIEVIDQSNGLYAEISQYDRGLFSAEAKITWKLHIPSRVVKDATGQAQTVPAQDYNVSMPMTIHHGPIIFADKRVRFGLGYAKSSFPFPQEYTAKFDETFSKESIKPQLNLSIFVNYLNQSTLDLNIPEFKLFAKEGNGRLDWAGMNATTTMSSEMKKIGGTVNLDGIQFTKEDMKATLTKVSSDYDLHQTASGLYLGDANFTLPSFNVLIKDQKTFEISALIFKSDSDIEEHLFNTHFTAAVESVFANGKNYGPGDFEVALRNLDADVLAKINQQTSEMQNGTEIQRQQAMLALLPELPKLFSKGAEFEISKLSLTIPEGQVEGSMFVALPKDDSVNPFELIQKVKGQAKLKMPAAAIKQMMQQSVIQQIAKQPDLQQTLTQQLQGAQPAATASTSAQPTLTIDQVATMQADKQLTALQQNGLIVLQGTDYLIEIDLAQGKFTVNGKPFDASMLKF
jgi:uncharacterized protein YdgA (DUF945 family)